VIIVAGDSDYIALAQKSKRLGRFVVGIGVAGSTSTSLAAACDEFEDYDSLPGIEKVVASETTEAGPAQKRGSSRKPAEPVEVEPEPAASKARKLTTIPMFSHTEDSQFDDAEPAEDIDPQTLATELLMRALQIGHAKGDADEWLNTGTVKNQMRRMDPSFNEKPLGFRSFTDFLSSRDDLVELDEDGSQRLIRLRPEADARS
jgi:hypothetical protein